MTVEKKIIRFTSFKHASALDLPIGSLGKVVREAEDHRGKILYATFKARSDIGSIDLFEDEYEAVIGIAGEQKE